MKIPLRDITSLAPAEIAAKGRYGVQRRLGRAPELAVARRLRDAHAALDAPADGPDVLVVTPRDWAVHLHQEAVLAHALQLRGARVRVLGCAGDLEVCDHNNCYRAPPMPCGSCTAYARQGTDAHGFERAELTYGPEPGWPELDGLTVDELYQVTWDDLPLGRLVEVPSQWFNMTTRVHVDPLAPENVRRFLRSARRVAAAAARHLDERRPDVVVLLNGMFFFESILWELCRARGIDVITYEAGFIAGTLAFRRNEAACYYDQAAWWDDRRARPLTDEEAGRLDDLLERRRSGGQTLYWDDATFGSLDRGRPGSLAVMFTNLTWDSAVIGRNAAFDSIHDWIAGAISAMEDRPDDELIVRIHPAETKLRGKITREPVADVVAERFPTLPSNVRILASEDTTSSYVLMDQADVGLVYTSTTGMELALSGTPTLVAGTPHYRGKGFTHDATDPADFTARLGALLDDPASGAPDLDLARRYAHLFFFESPYEYPYVRQVHGVPELAVADLAELLPGRSDDLDRLCDAILTGSPLGPVGGR